jgi:hypothetical protein
MLTEIIQTGALCALERQPREDDPPRVDPALAGETALEALARVDRFLRRARIPGFVSDGTLLGMIRERGFIPGDNDIDFKLPREHLTEGFIAGLAAEGFTPFRRAFVGGALANAAFFFKGLEVDFHGTTRVGDVMRYNLLFWPPRGYLTYEFPWSGRQRFRFRGVWLWRPRRPRRFLAAFYGPDWRVPATGWDNFFSPPGLVSVTGHPEIVARAQARWARVRGVGEAVPS